MLASLSCAVLTLWPNQGPWPLLPGVAPPLIRLARRKPAYRQTAYALPLALFLATGLVGVWAAYDRVSAREKFWLLAGSVLLFNALSQLEVSDLRLVLPLFLVGSAGFAVLFLLGTDWSAYQADLAILDRVSKALNAWRPDFEIPVPAPNISAGLLAMAAPFCVPAFHQARRSAPLSAAWLLAAGLILLGLLMSSSRAAWLALAIAGGAWLAGRSLSRQSLRLSAGLNLVLLLAAAVMIFWVLSPAVRITAFANSQGGVTSAASRADLLLNTLDLVNDFRFTGGGLGAFPGLYSQYILGIPQFYFGYSHNLYLDLALEQGVLGLIAFLLVWLGSIGMLVQTAPQARQPTQDTRGLRHAALAAIAVVLFQGLLDDPLYGIGGTAMVFLAPGITLAASGARPSSRLMGSISLAGAFTRKRLGLSLLLIAVTAAGAALVGRRSAARLQANLGAVEMAQIELAGWPTGEWSDGDELEELGSARRELERALALWPEEPAAQYRMGLLAMLERDYPAAVTHLRIALEQNPQHRGVRKALGLSYAWQGCYDLASGLLTAIPEAAQELQVYEWWWAGQGRPDLAEHARLMQAYLTVINPAG